MQKLTDAQQRAVELMREMGQANTMHDSGDDEWWYLFGNCGRGAMIPDKTMRALSRLGLVKIDGNTATLTEGAKKDR